MTRQNRHFLGLALLLVAISVSLCYSCRAPFLDYPLGELFFTKIIAPATAEVGQPVAVTLLYDLGAGGEEAGNVQSTVGDAGKKVRFSGQLLQQAYFPPFETFPQQPVYDIPVQASFTARDDGVYSLSAPKADASYAPDRTDVTASDVIATVTVM